MPISWEEYDRAQEAAALGDFKAKLEAAIIALNEGRNLKRYALVRQARVNCPKCQRGYVVPERPLPATFRCCASDIILSANRDSTNDGSVWVNFQEERVCVGGCWGLCSFGWKDADLDPEGCTGIESIVGLSDEAFTIRVGGHKTVCPPDDESQEGIAQELVWDTGGWNGEWDGDSWCFSFTEDVTVPYPWDDNRTDDENFVAIAKLAVEAALKAIEPFSTEMAGLDAAITALDSEEADLG